MRAIDLDAPDPGQGGATSTRRSPRGRRYRLSTTWVLMLCLGGLLVVTMPGCSGCRNGNQAKKPDEDKEKEKPKADFEVARMFIQPSDSVLSRNAVKPGHYITATQQMKANNFDFQADLQTASVGQNGQPMVVPDTEYGMVMSRPAALPKGQVKHFETAYYIPRSGTTNPKTVWLQSKLRSRRGGSEVTGSMQPTTRMPDYQYYFVAIAADPDSYGFLKQLDSVRPPADELDNEQLLYYRVVLPRLERRVPLPSNGLAWSPVAYVLWDGVNPNLLTPDQQTAMLDWLHWGGNLIVSGPDSLDQMRGSFLDPYLPASNEKSVDLDQAAFSELNEHWSMTGAKQVPLTLSILAEKPILGVQLKPTPGSQAVPDTGGLLVERTVGAGRIVVTAFRLSTPTIVNWKSYDNFFNACLLRRPRREFRKGEFGTPRAHFADFPGHEKEPRLSSAIRYFSRDAGHLVSNRTVAVAAPAPEKTLSHWRYAGFQSAAESGVGGWNDYSGVADAARDSLKDAAGISIPKAGFVFRMLAVYLVVLVPVNWTIFRLIGRVEWAWVAAPLIAIVGAVAVVRMAQLDIGFMRSRTEIATLEIQGDYRRAHLTRFTALYTSLAASYRMQFDNATALAQPFPTARGAGDSSSVRSVSFRRDKDLRLSGYQVDSNSTGMVHSEQMFDLEGTLELLGDDSSGLQLQNNTTLKLQAVGLLRGTTGQQVQVAWIGDLASKTAKDVRFVSPPNGRSRLEKWSESQVTQSYEVQIQQLLAEHDADNNGILSLAEVQAAGLHEELMPFDANQNGAWDRGETTLWVRRSRSGDGEISLGRLIDIAAERLTLRDGEIRLVGWTQQELPGMLIRPQASQSSLRTLVIAHLRRPNLPRPPRDANSRLVFGDNLPEDQTEPFDVLPGAGRPGSATPATGGAGSSGAGSSGAGSGSASTGSGSDSATSSPVSTTDR